ncbi:hypothetical protein IQ07DRAFT_630332 [Pyrenochaeta sp. DS3sAY3a]|nr:hypothetical protein IQ07DRAFT_630332 [Pyrenochaeta sp. DS3sAY3a]
MPRNIPQGHIFNFLQNHTIPLPLSSHLLNPLAENPCPICLTQYSSPPHDYVHPQHNPDAPEYAVQVRNKGPCKHIFGRTCIEKQIRAAQPWSHTCPLCRHEWFPAPNQGRTEVLGHVEHALNGLARVDVGDAEVRRELEDVEAAVERIREVLYGNRWV